jgi:hypothetical protein
MQIKLRLVVQQLMQHKAIMVVQVSKPLLVKPMEMVRVEAAEVQVLLEAQEQ